MSSEPYCLSFWVCSEAPSEIRRLLPADCDQGWVAHLSREVVDSPLMAFLRETAACARTCYSLTLADGSALLAACGKDLETQVIGAPEKAEK